MSKRMGPAIVVVLGVALLGCGGGSISAANGVSETPTASSSQHSTAAIISLEIADAPDGSCSNVATTAGSRRTQLIESCHGWVIASCNHILFFHARGVRADEGLLLLPGASSSRRPQIDADQAIGNEMRRLWGSDLEDLHLEFGETQCTDQGLRVSFVGSYVAQNTSGPAAAMRGTISVNSSGDVAVALQRE